MTDDEYLRQSMNGEVWFPEAFENDIACSSNQSSKLLIQQRVFEVYFSLKGRVHVCSLRETEEQSQAR